MKQAILITVGNTVDPILKALEETGKGATVFLLYGRPFPGQSPSPFEVANQAREKGRERGIDVQPREVANPEDLDLCLDEVRKIFKQAANAEEWIVNFTGGTKVLSAAAVHAALTEPLSGRLTFDYIGGAVRDAQGRVLWEAMQLRRSARTATDESVQQALDRFKQSQYREVRLLVEPLPRQGRAGFIWGLSEALCRWDEFDYDQALHLLGRLRDPGRALADDELLAPLARMADRLREPCSHLNALATSLRQLEQGRGSWGQEAEHFPLLVADALENSQRRLREGRPTDSVLRAYRAVEIAVQANLLCRGINPWHPDWQSVEAEVKKRFLDSLKTNQLPHNLALNAGVKLLAAMGVPWDEEREKRLIELQQLRNHSYLEHGYLRLTDSQAECLHEHASFLCQRWLDSSLEEARARVRHQL